MAVKILGLNHIGMVPKDLKKSKWFFEEVLQLAFKGREVVQEQQTLTYFYPAASNSAHPLEPKLELLEPLTPDKGPIAQYISTKGGGIHHLAFQVEDLRSLLQHMKAQGVQMIDEEPRKGAHQTQIAFVHPRSTGGFLVEFVESLAYEGPS